MGENVKESIRREIIGAGACRVGFAEAGPVGTNEEKRYRDWLKSGNHGEMGYLERYEEIRCDPRLLLDGAKTVISCAFDYRQPESHPLFADYALGRDYHETLRERLSAVTENICCRFGGNARVCVDTAPIHERYWAARSGIGIIGLNGQLIVDGIGSKVVLSEILWTGSVEADRSRLGERCKECGACVAVCPGKALDGRGGLDARRCYSYLSIEYRGELPDDLKFDGRIYGCDICQDICPHNVPTDRVAINDFSPTPAMMALGIDDIKEMDDEKFRSIFRHSAVKRAKLSGLRRNALRHDEENQDF